MIPMHIRLSAIGDLGPVGTERFSYGVTLASYGSAGTLRQRWTTAPAADWNVLAQATMAFHSRSDTKISPHCRLTEVKLALIGPDPEDPNRKVYLEPPKSFPFNMAGAVIGPSQFTLPQNAIAVSLQTGGLGKIKGRFYIPMPHVAAVPEDSFRISHVDAGLINSSARTWLNALSAADIGGVNNDLQVVVLSGPTPTKPDRGFLTEVVSTRVGRVVDNISTRRRSLAESYSTPLLLVSGD